MSTPETQPGTDLAPVISQELMSQFAAMAAGIPAATDEDAYESIVTQLINADGIDELNAPWDTADLSDLTGYRLRIDQIQRRDSDYAGGLGMYMVLKGVNLGTGDKFVFTTGSVSIVAQLARAWFLGGFPVTCEIQVADTPTKNGYRPQHLKVLGFGGSQ